MHKNPVTMPALFLLAIFAVSEVATADRVVMRRGPELHGAVLPPEPDRPGLVLVLTSSTTKPYEFHQEDVLKVVPAKDDMTGYLDQLSQTPATPEGELSLGQWCEQRRLPGPAQRHYQRALDLDPQLGPAHEKLGHIFHNGRWMTHAQKQEAQGLVKYKGRWVSTQQKEALEHKAAFTTEQQNWMRRLRVIRDHLLSGNPTQRQAAEDEIAAIREPAAVQPLVRTFGNDSEPYRQRLGQVLGGISGPESREALIWLILAEPEIALRQTYLRELETRHEPEIENRLMKALDSKDPVTVGRAAWALAELRATAAVPKLIGLLVKVEEKMIVEDAQTPTGYSLGFGGVVGANTFPTPGTPGTPHHAGGNSGMPGQGFGGIPAVGVSGNAGFATGVPFPVMTGPTVGPGTVAFGATAAPFFNGVGMGNGGALRPNAQVVTNLLRNEEVHQALMTLTGEDFEFDVPTWREWQKTRFQLTPSTPQRQVRQP